MTNGFGCRFGFSILFLWAAHAPASVQIDKAPGATTYRFHVDRVTLDPAEEDEERYIKVRLEGLKGYEGLVAEEGKPEIPAIHFYVDGEGDIQVSPGTPDNPWSRGSFVKVFPFQPSQAKRPNQPYVFYYDRAAYASSELYPFDAYSVEKVGLHKGKLRRLVRLYPIRFEAAAGRFEIIRRFEVKVIAAAEPARAPGRKTLAVVAGATFDTSPALDSYVAFKKTQGFDVVRVHFGRDAKTPADLRKALSLSYKDPKVDLRQILLVGDNGEVPGYTSDLLEGVTDHYYRCLDSDYESDIGAPDVALGRFAVETEAELAVVVKKQIRYEQGNFKDRSWLKRFSLIATDDSSHFQVAEASFDYLTDRYTGPQGYFGNFPKLAQTGGDLLYAIRHSATGSQVVERLKEGRGFINYGGHGNEDSWDGPEVSQEDVESIHHEATPFVMSNACITGKFVVDSFAETWQRHESGSVAFWGSMDSTYWDEDDVLQRKVYDVLFRDGNRRIEDFTDAGLEEVWRFYGGKGRSKYYWETYVVFGDPSTEIRLKQ